MKKILMCLGLLFKLNIAMAQMQMDHSHMPITVPENATVPALSLMLETDVMSGYNLIVDTKNYIFMPPPAALDMMQLMSADIDEPTNQLKGHGHLYVNGVKIQRVYGKYVHLPASLFSSGVNTISVTLNNHGHMYWTVNEKKIVATLYINDQVDTLVTYRFESFPIDG